MQLFLLILLSGACFGEKADVQFDFTDSDVVDLNGQDALNAFIGKSHVTAVYYYKKGNKTNFSYKEEICYIVSSSGIFYSILGTSTIPLELGISGMFC